jgi:ABC-type multidrug transport system fused ATPase/permease subunit
MARADRSPPIPTGPVAASDRRQVAPRDLARFYRVFGRHYGRYVPLLLAAFASLVTGIGLALLVPWPLAWMIDYVIKAEPVPSFMAPFAAWIELQPRSALALFATCFVLIKLLHAIITYFDKYLVALVAEYIAADIRERVFAQLQRLTLAFHQSSDSGDLIVRMTRDIGDIRELLVKQPEVLIRSVGTLLAFASMMLWLDWKLALVALSILPLLFAITHYTQSRLRKAEGKRKRRESRLARVVGENVRTLALVQAYGQESTERALFDVENQESLAADVRGVRLSRRLKRMMDLLIALATAALLYVGGSAVLGGELTLGIFVVFYSYVDELYGPVGNLVTSVLAIARHRVAGERLLELVENDRVVRDRRGAVPAPPLRGRIEFRDVHFGYPGAPDVLRGVSFTIEPGETVALVGRSGAGKSTLISLLLRFFDSRGGEIRIDDRDIGDYQIASLRAQTTILPQDAPLLRRSLRENIAFGRPTATEAEIVAAAKAAEAHEFIDALPDGYDHVPGESGVDLSGGQRQRIHIARALIRETPILIMDEPVGGLDAASEAAICAALERLTEHRTTLVVAHRLATIQRADRILVLDEGRIAEQGTHEELVAASSLYRELHLLQIRGLTAA